MATYRKRGSNWQVQIRREDHPPLSKTFRLRADGERWARSIESAIDRGELIPSSGSSTSLRSFGDLMTRYKELVTSKKRGKSIEEIRITKILQHSLCQVSIKSITPSLIAQYRDQRLKTVKGETVRRELVILSHAFNVAIREWGVPILVNPVSSIDKPKPAHGRNRRVSQEELNTLLEEGKNSRNTELLFAIQLAVHTGMRRGELLLTRWEHIDLDNSLLHIVRTKNGIPREIPLTNNAKAILLEMGPLSSGLVFNTSANALRLSWERLRKRAGLEDLRFHDLRHEAISRFFEMGLSLPEVALISGHREPRMLMRYTHLRAGDIVNKLNRR
ncbi:integrase [Sneathiella glossodoripedis]|uniref:integrase n=1 Tax=Sneathiella glossodoripedis TaxID=418853 RepID=UPI000470AAA3|nr:site-specific integrase [Sneathiella glossodoripedis]